MLQDNLPEILQDKIPENQTDWTSFVKAIKAVELGHIREGVRKYKERVAEAEKIQAQLSALERCTANNMALLNSPTKNHPRPTKQNHHISINHQSEQPLRERWRPRKPLQPEPAKPMSCVHHPTTTEEP